MKLVAIWISLGVTCACISAARAGYAVGEQATLDYQTTDGKKVDMDALRGRIVVVDFWATWCGPCMEEAPHMVQLNRKYGDRGLVMLGISLDSDLNQMKQVAKEKGFTWPQYFDGMVGENKIAAAWGVTGIPHTVVIDPDGKIVYSGHPADGLDKAIEKTFKETPPRLIDPLVMAAARKSLDAAASKLSAGDIEGAAKQLARIDQTAKADPDFIKRFTQVQADVESHGEAMLADVDPLIEKENYREAIANLRNIVSKMTGLAVADKAKQKLAALNLRPDVRKALADGEKADRDAERQSKASEALAAAQKLLDAGTFSQAYVRLKFVSENYDGTSAAATAAELTKTLIKNHPEIVAQKAESADLSKAKAALSMANSYRDSNRTDLAREKYKLIISAYPGTTYADQAREALDAMGN